jgi:hypothetical protein
MASVNVIPTTCRCVILLHLRIMAGIPLVIAMLVGYPTVTGRRENLDYRLTTLRTIASFPKGVELINGSLPSCVLLCYLFVSHFALPYSHLTNPIIHALCLFVNTLYDNIMLYCFYTVCRIAEVSSGFISGHGYDGFILARFDNHGHLYFCFSHWYTPLGYQPIVVWVYAYSIVKVRSM